MSPSSPGRPASPRSARLSSSWPAEPSMQRWPRDHARHPPASGGSVGARLTDSPAYAHLWGTEETRGLFDEEARWQRWLDILVALAGAQADLGIIPQRS